MKKRSELDVQAADEAVEAARVDVLTQVVARFMDMLSTRETIRATEQQAARTREQIAFTEALVEAGRLPRVDLLDLQAQLAREELDVVTNENQYDRARLQMTQLLQLTPQEAATFDIAAPTLAAVQPSDPDADMVAMVERVLATHPAYQERATAGGERRAFHRDRPDAAASFLSFNATVATGYSGRDIVTVGDPIIGEPTQIGFTEGGENVYTPNIQYETETRDFGVGWTAT